ncbi:transient receptor potential cation channel subfamily M member 7, partial [Haematococcus lacustris]
MCRSRLVQVYYFAHLTQYTKIMLQRFVAASSPGTGGVPWIQEEQLDNIQHLPDKLIIMASQAFSHWTYNFSSGVFMVTDLQGVWNADTGIFWLCDPAVHCPSDIMRFGNTNLGLEGCNMDQLMELAGLSVAAALQQQYPLPGFSSFSWSEALVEALVEAL